MPTIASTSLKFAFGNEFFRDNVAARTGVRSVHVSLVGRPGFELFDRFRIAIDGDGKSDG